MEKNVTYLDEDLGNSEDTDIWFVEEDEQLYGDLTYRINGALIKVHEELGPGWDETDYHKLFLRHLEGLGLSYQSLLRGRFIHQGQEIDRFELDVLIEDEVIVELKHLKQGFSPAHMIQLINYLTFWDKKVGLLCNFGHENVRLRRLQMHLTSPLVTLQGIDQKVAQPPVWQVVRSVTHSLVEQNLHTYCLKTLNNLMPVECQAQGLKCERLTVRPNIPNIDLPPRTVDAWCLNERFLLYLAGNPKGPAPQNLSILKTYLRHSNLESGILLNFAPREIVMALVTH